MALSLAPDGRRAVAPVSQSPLEKVTEQNGGVHRAGCGVCAAHHDAPTADAAWMWLETHLCGLGTIHLH